MVNDGIQLICQTHSIFYIALIIKKKPTFGKLWNLSKPTELGVILENTISEREMSFTL